MVVYFLGTLKSKALKQSKAQWEKKWALWMRHLYYSDSARLGTLICSLHTSLAFNILNSVMVITKWSDSMNVFLVLPLKLTPNAMVTLPMTQ